MELVRGQAFRELPAHRKMLILILLLALKDWATGLRFEPYPVEDGEGCSGLALRLQCEVNGTFLDLVPPPHSAWLSILKDLKEMAGLSTSRRLIGDRLRRLASRIGGRPVPPRQGRFHMSLGEAMLDAELIAWPSDLGDRVVLKLPAGSKAISDSADAEMRRVIQLLESPTGHEGNQGPAPEGDSG